MTVSEAMQLASLSAARVVAGMLLTNRINTLEGVIQSSIMMGTDANKDIFRNTGLLTPEAEAANPSDMVIVVSRAMLSEKEKTWSPMSRARSISGAVYSPGVEKRARLASGSISAASSQLVASLRSLTCYNGCVPKRKERAFWAVFWPP